MFSSVCIKLPLHIVYAHVIIANNIFWYKMTIVRNDLWHWRNLYTSLMSRKTALILVLWNGIWILHTFVSFASFSITSTADSTGTHSLYAAYQDYEIMFHVSTMLPFTANNRQQLLRKRHIGNDIVTIVFQEEGSEPFTPKNVRSQFQHVFVVVRAHDSNTDNVHYRWVVLLCLTF